MKQIRAAGRVRTIIDYRAPSTPDGGPDRRRTVYLAAALSGAALIAAFQGPPAHWPVGLLFLLSGLLALTALGLGLACVRHRHGRPALLVAVACLAAWAGAIGLYVNFGMGYSGRSSATARNIKCASNLRQTGIALERYAARHGGAYPDSLATLYLDAPGDVDLRCFVCPGSRDRVASGDTPQQVAAKLAGKGCISYTYVGQSLTSPPSRDDVVAFDVADHHLGSGVTFLFGDGHVEFIPSPAAQAVIKQAQSGVRPVRFPPPATQPGP